MRVTHGRFEELHRHVIRWPAERFNYVGIDDEGDTTEHYAGEVGVPNLDYHKLSGLSNRSILLLCGWCVVD